MLILTDLPPRPPALIPVLCGPPAPTIKGLTPHSSAFSTARASRNALREMPGAVVSIEDDALIFLTKLPSSVRLFHDIRLFTGTGTGTSPMPVWMDPNVTMSGGNVAGRVYTFGGANF